MQHVIIMQYKYSKVICQHFVSAFFKQCFVEAEKPVLHSCTCIFINISLKHGPEIYIHVAL